MEIPTNTLEKLAANSFSFFSKSILKHKVSKVHDKIANLIYNELTSDKVNKTNFGIEFPRGHGKTTVFSTAFPLWLAYKSKKEDELSISIRSASQKFSIAINRRIKRHIEGNKYLRSKLLPDSIYHALWSAESIITKNDVSIFSVPYNQRGNHVHLSICDDIQTDDDAASDISLKRVISSYWGSIYPTTQTKNGVQLVIGTPLTFNDIFDSISQSDGFKLFKFPAVKIRENEDNKIEFYDPIFPELVPLEKYYDIYKNTPSWVWQREYLLNPIGDSDSIFPMELIKSSVNLELPNKVESREYFLGCDIALSNKKSADYSCFTVIERINSKVLNMVYSWHEKGVASDEQFNVIKKLHKKYNFIKIVIEQNGVGYSLAQKCAADPELQSVSILFHTSPSNKAKVVGNLEILMRSRELRIMNDESLISEMKSFGKVGSSFKAISGHDDRVISLGLACYYASTYNLGYVPTSLVII